MQLLQADQHKDSPARPRAASQMATRLLAPRHPATRHLNQLEKQSSLLLARPLLLLLVLLLLLAFVQSLLARPLAQGPAP
jgi:hypothetical protein